MSPVVVRLLVVAAVVAAAWVVGRWWRARDGALRAPTGARAGPAFDPDRLSALGLDVGGAAALGLLLSSPGCAPCRTVQRILREVAAERDRFRWTVVDAADHLDLAEAHHVMRVPTLFVLTPGGRILARTSGVPATRELVAVLDREQARAPGA